MAYEYEGSLNDTTLVDKKYLSELERKARAFDVVIERSDGNASDVGYDVIKIVDNYLKENE